MYLYAYFAVPPRVTDELRNLTIAFNSTFTKECYLRGDPQVSVNWTKDGVLLSKNNTLVIRQVTFEDKGYYECTARNDYGEAKSSFWIDVTGKSYIVDYVINQTFNLTKRLVLKFKPNLNRTVFVISKTINVTWKKDGDSPSERAKTDTPLWCKT